MGRVMLRETGKSLSQCFFKAAPRGKSMRNPKKCDITQDNLKKKRTIAFKKCIKAMDQKTAELHVIGGKKTWPAGLCALHGAAKFSKQENDPGLVAVLPFPQKQTCFPIR